MARQSLELARLFYTVEADTKGFQRDLDAAQRSAVRFTDFILAHPVVAAGALGAALVGVGIKAAAMAAETDQAVRRIAAVLPDAIGKFKELEQAVDGIARSSGISEEALLATAQALASSSKDLPDLIQRLRAVQVAADATGIDMGTLADQLTRVLHVFDLNGDQIEIVAAKLKFAAQGKVSLEDLLESFRTAAPALRAAGVDFDTGAAALAKLVGEGLNAKGVASALKALAEQGGQAVRDFAGPAIDGAHALKTFHDAATLVADGAQRNGDKIRENLNATMRQLGDELLPLVNAGLKATNFLLEQMAGAVTRIPDQVSLAGSIAAALTGGPATLGAGGGRTPFDHGAPVKVPEISVVADPAAIKARADFQQETERVLKSLSDGLKGAAVAALDDFLAEYRKVADTLTTEQRRAAEQAIAELRGKVLESQATTPELITHPETVGIRAEGLDRLDQTLDAAAKHQKDLADAAEREKRARAESLQHALNLSRQIEQAARGGLQLAEAFGLVGTNAAKALESIVQIGAAVPGILVGDPTAILSAAGGLASLISGLFSGGETPEQKHSREIAEANVKALNRLADSLDSFASNLTGTQQTTGQSGVTALLNARGGILDPTKPQSGALDLGRIGAILAGVGTNLTKLEELAKTFGITLDETNAATFTDSLKQLQTALQDADRIRFLDSFTGQMDALNARFQLLNITDPVEKLKEILGVLTDLPHQVKITLPGGGTELRNVGNGSPAIAQALAGLDLGSAGDRAKAQDKLAQLLQELTSGQIDAAGLGGLTAEQFKQEILDLGGLLRDANAQVGGQSQSFAVDRTITEITGSRIASLLDTSLLYQSALPEIRDLLAAAFAGGLILAPSLPASLTAAAGPSIIVQSLQVNITAPVGSSPEAFGQAVGAAVVDQLLAQRAGLKQTVAGGVLQ
jgi:hypothetical protein